MVFIKEFFLKKADLKKKTAVDKKNAKKSFSSSIWYTQQLSLI